MLRVTMDKSPGSYLLANHILCQTENMKRGEKNGKKIEKKNRNLGGLREGFINKEKRTLAIS